ncbi:uncharacterized protein A4U43_C01F21810 [Asparagus officinalis]|uniref:RING-type E3 ubiquitin transferase n=1 Tax=Asparagus officinalis TaxID=4686 RepID=A0A5P1FR58_ASPOF|nr:uncharacterized protein LOC109827085 [Asparagus officinalis]ONK80795.1 uncharacterized protein A4U43_C01F21810 [Asparagus officinalis]
MGIVPVALNVAAVSLFMIFTLTSSYQMYQSTPISSSLEEEEDPSMIHTYARFSEVEKACKPILSSASNIRFDVNRITSFKPELSFDKGDWRQDSGDAPLMPFNGSDPNPIYLSSFQLTHVDVMPHSQISINVSGSLGLGISRNGTAPDLVHYLFPEFRIWPGSSELRILFEGVYVESEENGGERVLCLLGNAMLPSRDEDSKDPWPWVKELGKNNFQPSLSQDDQILLVIRYPKTFTLTTRGVSGEMSSLNERSSTKFFDKLHFSSQLGVYTNYEFGSAKIVAKACSPYPYRDNIVDGDTQSEIYKGVGLCGILEQFVTGEVFNVLPNWNCNSTDEYCSKLGPFASEREIKATDGGFANVGLIMQDMRCEPRRSGPRNISSARVSAVFRAIPPWESQFLASQRTGLSNMTLSAEGIWVSSAGQLCMVGCLGLGDAKCNSRICLYIPSSFSINQRNIIFGKISHISNTLNESHYPLSFERSVHPMQLWNKYGGISPLSTYKYSKIKLAGAFLERSEPFDFASTIKKSLLSYPKMGGDSDELVNLSNLSDDLTLHVPAVPDPLPNERTVKPFLQLELLSLGSLFGRYWAYHNESISPVSVQSPSKDTSTERQLLLNVSAELTLSGEPYKNVSLLYLEGLYNPVDGRMYLIGCRDVRASWKILFESMDLEDGLDCLIEVKIEYPPTTARWLMNPTAKVLITSRRTEDDPLHFSQIKLQTLPILYREQREDILSRRGVEGFLRILTLSLVIACILSQLFYVRVNTGLIPFISLVMLGVQALGYSIPLITGAEALFARISSEPYETPSYELEKNQWFEVVDYIVKIMVLIAFLLTLRLGQKVWKSRIRLLTRSPLEPWRVPNDKRILLISFVIHLIGFSVVIIVHGVNTSKRPIKPAAYIDSRGNSHKLHEWGMQLEEYVGLVQDFFLLPQIIGNFLWQIDGKPLRKAYYFGITIVRILPHVYDYIRAPDFNPYFSEQYEFVNPSLDFYSMFGDIAIPVTAIVFAAIVYVQQRWNYQKLSENLRVGQKKLLPLGSRVYERLPSVSFEAELVSGVSETSTHDTLEKNEE